MQFWLAVNEQSCSSERKGRHPPLGERLLLGVCGSHPWPLSGKRHGEADKLQLAGGMLCGAAPVPSSCVGLPQHVLDMLLTTSTWII